MLQDSILKNYKQKPNHTAVVYNGSKYTYADLWISVIKMACWLDENVVSEARIGILLDNSYEAVVSIYSIVMSKRICIPIGTDMHNSNVTYIINDASISLILTSSKYLEKIKKINKKNKFKIILTDDLKSEVDSKLINNKNKLDIYIDAFKPAKKSFESAIAFILYTTGTSKVKLVEPAKQKEKENKTKPKKLL